MQRTFTFSAAIVAIRSAGSKRTSCSTAAAPQSHGVRKTLRADFDQPLAAVHHAISPGRASNQLLGLELLAGEAAVGVDDGLGFAGRAGGEDHHRRVAGRGVEGRGAGRGPAASRRGSRSSGRPSRRLRARRGCARRVTTSFGAALAIRSARSFARSISLQGSTTAPMRQQPSIAKTHCGRLPISVMHHVAAPTPCAANAPP